MHITWFRRLFSRRTRRPWSRLRLRRWFQLRTIPLSLELLESRILPNATVAFDNALWNISPGPVYISGGQVELPTVAPGSLPSTVVGAVQTVAVQPGSDAPGMTEKVF